MFAEAAQTWGVAKSSIRDDKSKYQETLLCGGFGALTMLNKTVALEVNLVHTYSYRQSNNFDFKDNYQTTYLSFGLNNFTNFKALKNAADTPQYLAKNRMRLTGASVSLLNFKNSFAVIIGGKYDYFLSKYVSVGATISTTIPFGKSGFGQKHILGGQITGYVPLTKRLSLYSEIGYLYNNFKEVFIPPQHLGYAHAGAFYFLTPDIAFAARVIDYNRPLTKNSDSAKWLFGPSIGMTAFLK